MNRHTIRASLFVTAMLAASATFAGTDIVKCVDQDGQVTLTDSHCGEAVEKVQVAGSAEMPAAEPTIDAPAVAAVPAVRRSAVQRFVLPPAAPRHSSWSVPRPASRPLARDVETLRAARVSMQVLDQASAALKHQRMAGLN
jgi:hypothetical protein